MKKYARMAVVYAIIALLFGVYDRLLTQFFAFEGKTALVSVHGHLFALGTLFHLVLVVLMKQFEHFAAQKKLGVAMGLYNLGLIWTFGLMTLRGTLEVMGVVLASGLNGAISGVAGIGHMVFSIGIVWVLVLVAKSVELG